jgi:hypothetical protein
MNILAHPLYEGGYIIYLLDPNNSPYRAEITQDKNKISTIAFSMSKGYNISKAEYVDDFRLNSDKQKWKILW